MPGIEPSLEVIPSSLRLLPTLPSLKLYFHLEILLPLGSICSLPQDSGFMPPLPQSRKNLQIFKSSFLASRTPPDPDPAVRQCGRVPALLLLPRL